MAGPVPGDAHSARESLPQIGGMVRRMSARAADVARVPLTRAEYEVLVDAGMLDDQRVELLCGDKAAMSPESYEHADVVEDLGSQLEAVVGSKALQVRRGHPVALSDLDEPEPDLALVTWVPPRSRGGHPRPHEVHLLVEVSGTSLDKDMGIKSRRYAMAGIVEYWVVDLVGRRVVVHTEPDVEQQRYTTVTQVPFGAELAPAALDGPVVVR